MPPRSAKKPAPLPSMFKAVAEKRSNELHQDFDFDLVEKPAKKQARMPPPPPLVEEPRGAAFVRLDGIKNELNSRFQIMAKEVDKVLRDEIGGFLESSCNSIEDNAAEHLRILNESIKASQIAQQQIGENHLTAMQTVKATFEEEKNKAAEKAEEILEIVHKVGAAAKNEAQGLLTKYTIAKD